MHHLLRFELWLDETRAFSSNKTELYPSDGLQTTSDQSTNSADNDKVLKSLVQEGLTARCFSSIWLHLLLWPSHCDPSDIAFVRWWFTREEKLTKIEWKKQKKAITEKKKQYLKYHLLETFNRIQIHMMQYYSCHKSSQMQVTYKNPFWLSTAASSNVLLWCLIKNCSNSWAKGRSFSFLWVAGQYFRGKLDMGWRCM